jgi:predicted nucleic acid-binding protein
MSGIVAGQLIDTDVLIDHFRGRHAFKPPRGRSAYSVVTRAELFAGQSADEGAIGFVLGRMQEYPVNRAVAERAGRLRRRCALRMADAMIAATAVEYGMTLVTRNMRDFTTVPGLKVRPPS